MITAADHGLFCFYSWDWIAISQHRHHHHLMKN